MYRYLLRPLFFLLDAERAHYFAMFCLRIIHLIPFAPNLFSVLFGVKSSKLNRSVLGLNFKNPVGLAAGFDKNAAFLKPLASLGFGFIEIGTLTPKPQPGNAKPRLFRLKNDAALINRMGFNNKGVLSAVENLKKFRRHDCIIGGNIGKNTATDNCDAVADYVMVFNELFPYCDYFVVNVSCPNITNLRELQDAEKLRAILLAVISSRNSFSDKKPVLLKVSPDLNDDQLLQTVELVHELGVDGFVLTNTSVSRQALISHPDMIASIGNGGLSGKPLFARTIHFIERVRSLSNLPIIAVGGIFSPNDARLAIEKGADLVQVYTGFIYEGPFFPKNILKALL